MSGKIPTSEASVRENPFLKKKKQHKKKPALHEAWKRNSNKYITKKHTPTHLSSIKGMTESEEKTKSGILGSKVVCLVILL